MGQLPFNLADLWLLFVYAIGGLFACSAFMGLCHILRYRRESRAVEQVQVHLRRLVADASRGKPKVRHLVAPADLLQGLRSNTIVADRIASIKRLRESLVKVNLAALQHMTLAKEASRKWLAVPAFASSVSVMIGLLGTVIGLSVMVQQISSGLPSDPMLMTLEAWIASMNQIRRVLGGMNTAFAATMAGLVSAIILSWLNHRLSRSQAAFLDQLDRFTTEELLPHTVPAVEEEHLLEKVSAQLEASFARLDEAVQTNCTTLQELRAVEKGLMEIVESVRQTTRAESPGKLQELMGRLSGITEQVAKVNQSVVNALPGLVKEAQGANSANLQRIDRLISAYEQRAPDNKWSPRARLALGLMGVTNMFLFAVLLLR